MINHRTYCECVHCRRRMQHELDCGCWLCEYRDEYNQRAEYGDLWDDTELSAIRVDREISFFGWSNTNEDEIPF